MIENSETEEVIETEGVIEIEKDNWVIMKDGRKYWLDGYLKSNLDIIKKKLREDWDYVLIIDGVEGSGKSQLAQQIAQYIYPDFSLNDICFTPEQWETKIIFNSEKFSANIYDEAITGLFARQTYDKTNIRLVQILAQLRQKNLFSIIVLPCIFDLEKNIALHRGKGLIHLYLENGWDRGQFAFFGRKSKTYLYSRGKRFYDYSVQKSDFWASYCNFWVIPEAIYNIRKNESLKEFSKGKGKAELRRDFFLWNAISYFYSQKMSWRKIGQIIKTTDHTTKNIFEKGLPKKTLAPEISQKYGLDTIENEQDP